MKIMDYDDLMPLVSVSSYLTVFNEFLNHWDNVNKSLPEPLVTMEGGLAVGQELQAELEKRLADVHQARWNFNWERLGVLYGRAVLRRELEQFNLMVRGYWEGTPWEELLTPLPEVDVSLERFLKPCRRAVMLWEELEGQPLPAGAPSPLKVGGTVTRAEFAAKVEALRLAGLAVEAADFALALARSRRNVVMKKVRAMLMSYTKALPGRVKAGSSLLDAMPRLWPLPGHTPDAVEASGEWLAVPGLARLTWTASAEAELDFYHVRSCVGEDYKKEDEHVVTKIPADGERQWESSEGFTQPGAAMSYRIYVVLKTGNEKGSKTVTVTRG